MKTKQILYLAVIFSLILVSGCKNPPKAAFTFEPQTNPEAFDTIYFTNTSEDAASYEWDFGDGSSGSTEEHPIHIFEDVDDFTVTLTATNKDGSTQASQTISINDPTILAFIVYEDDTVTIIPDCEVWLYGSKTDWDNFTNPLVFETTDNDGIVLILNLEAQVYYIDFYKEEGNGFWYSGGELPVLVQNDINPFYAVCEFYEFTSKKSRQTMEDRIRILKTGRSANDMPASISRTDRLK